MCSLPTQTTGMSTSQRSGLDAISQQAGQQYKQRQRASAPSLPSKPKVGVPDPEELDMMCCPPEELLLEQFRLEREMMVQVGGVLPGLAPCYDLKSITLAGSM